MNASRTHPRHISPSTPPAPTHARDERTPVSGRFAHRRARQRRAMSEKPASGASLIATGGVGIADGVKSGPSGVDELHMPDEREPRSSRRRFLGTMIGAACACGFAATATATPRAPCGGVDRPSRRARHRTEDGRTAVAATAPGSRGQAVVPGVTGHRTATSSTTSAMPRGSTRLHEGVDIMGSRDMPVFAVVSGVLTQRYTNTGTAGWGWTLYDTVDDDDLQVLPPRRGRRRPECRQFGVGGPDDRLRRQQRHVR